MFDRCATVANTALGTAIALLTLAACSGETTTNSQSTSEESAPASIPSDSVPAAGSVAASGPVENGAVSSSFAPGASVLVSLGSTDLIVSTDGIVVDPPRTRLNQDGEAFDSLEGSLTANDVLWLATEKLQMVETDRITGPATRERVIRVRDPRFSILPVDSIEDADLVVGLRAISESDAARVEADYIVTFVAEPSDGSPRFLGRYSDQLNREFAAVSGVAGTDDLFDVTDIVQAERAVEVTEENHDDRTRLLVRMIDAIAVANGDAPVPWIDQPPSEREFRPAAVPPEHRDEFEAVGLELRMPASLLVDSPTYVSFRSEWGSAHSFDVDVGTHIALALRGVGENLQVVAGTNDGPERSLGELTGVPAGAVAVIQFVTDPETGLATSFELVEVREPTDTEQRAAGGQGVGTDGRLLPE